MAFTNDYGVHIPAARTLAPFRILTLLTNYLHLASTTIVLGISAYFIKSYTHNTHLVYWLTVACIDLAFALPLTIAYPLIDPPRIASRFLGTFQWVFTYLWLTAFIFAAQDYNFGDTCERSPSGVRKCGLKRTLEAFAFLAFFTGVVGVCIETKFFGLLGKTQVGAAPLDEKAVEPAPAAAPAPVQEKTV
jgi:hypothetical protein